MPDTYTIHNDFLQVRIKRKGAELCSVKNNTNTEFIWQASSIWNRHAPNLFPIVGSLLDHEYRYNDKNIALTHHGFARDMDFDMLHQSEHSICFILQNDEFTWRSYPFNFTLLITFTLENNSLIQSYRVLNTDTKTIPVSFGGHPAFNANPIGDFEIYFESNESIYSNMLDGPYISNQLKPIIVDNKISLDLFTFNEDALIFQKLQSKWVKLVHAKSSYAVKVDITDFPYLGIWSKPGAPFVCIEPWQGLADFTSHNKDIFSKKGIIALGQNQEINRQFSMEFTG